MLTIFNLRYWTLHISYAMLALLTLQTSAFVLLLRYSRLKGFNEGQYLATTAVFLAEVMKLSICIAIVWVKTGYNLAFTYEAIWNEVIMKLNETKKLVIPSILYTVQNNLLFYGLTVLDAATYQVTYQLKILTTALFSVFMMNRTIRPLQWTALLLLLVGVAIVQVQSSPNTPTPMCVTDPSAPSCVEGVSTSLEHWTGLLSIVVASICSGYASVYYEKLVKEGEQMSVVIRNIQLGIFSVLFGGIGMLYYDSKAIFTDGFFQGYNWLTWVVIIFQAVGGLTVAATIKYADNIQKSFATSVSIVISALCSHFFLNAPGPTWLFTFGVTLVIGSTVLYAYFTAPSSGLSLRELNAPNDILLRSKVANYCSKPEVGTRIEILQI